MYGLKFLFSDGRLYFCEKLHSDSLPEGGWTSDKPNIRKRKGRVKLYSGSFPPFFDVILFPCLKNKRETVGIRLPGVGGVNKRPTIKDVDNLPLILRTYYRKVFDHSLYLSQSLYF